MKSAHAVRVMLWPFMQTTTWPEKKLDWEPKYSLDEMMLTAWQWEQRLSADNSIFSGKPLELN
jgi:hypothetical protein